MNLFRFGSALLLAGGLLFGQADNTSKNKMEPNKTEPNKTADKQMNNKGDIEITRKIRKMLTDDATLSTYAKNIKVITRMSKVTLRGPVNTVEEKKTVMDHAVMVAGATNVTDQTEVMKNKKEKM
jgi:hyperosmotically inducible periplasmic protein